MLCDAYQVCLEMGMMESRAKIARTQKKNKCQIKIYILKQRVHCFVYTQQFIIFLEEFNNFKFQQYYNLILIL